VSREAETAGREVITRLRDACAADKIELVASIRVLFPSITARSPDFHALMEELARDDQHDAIARILRVPGKRGPKRQDEFELISLIEHVMQTEGLTEAAEAIRRLAEILDEERAKPLKPGERPPPFLPAEHTLRTRHSTLHKLFRLWSGSVYVPAELLTAEPWTPPGYVPEPPPKLVMTKLSNAIVFHAPEDTVTEPKKEN